MTLRDPHPGTERSSDWKINVWNKTTGPIADLSRVEHGGPTFAFIDTKEGVEVLFFLTLENTKILIKRGSRNEILIKKLHRITSVFRKVFRKEGSRTQVVYRTPLPCL